MSGLRSGRCTYHKGSVVTIFSQQPGAGIFCAPHLNVGVKAETLPGIVGEPRPAQTVRFNPEHQQQHLTTITLANTEMCSRFSDRLDARPR